MRTVEPTQTTLRDEAATVTFFTSLTKTIKLIEMGFAFEIMSDTILKHQVARWKRQHRRGGMPQELFALIGEGFAGHEKRVVIKLAFHSDIVNNEGEIRQYEEFKQDWKYEKSIYGEADTCALCGNYPIVENCILTNEKNGETLIVGNTCVTRYIEIGDMDEYEKRKWLKGKMKSAKQVHLKQKWNEQYPSVMLDLARFELMMKENKQLKILHQQMIRRITNDGFAGPKLWRQWDEFMLTSESRYVKWELEQKENQKRMAERLRENESRKLAMAHEINRRRNKWNEEANAWIERVSAFEHYSITEHRWIGKIETTIRTKGAHSLPAQQSLFFHTMNRAHKLLTDCSDESPDVQTIMAYHHSPKLNSHQRAFCRNYAARLSLGYKITNSQMEQMNRLKRKWVR